MHQKVIENINLGTSEVKQEKIGISLSSSARQKVIDLLKEYVDVLAWSYQDMPRLDIKIVVHSLPLKTKCASVKQKLRRVKPEMLLKIKK